MNWYSILIGVLTVIVVLEITGLLVLMWITKNKLQYRTTTTILSPYISHYISPRKPPTKNSRIPKQIFQTFAKNRMAMETYNATRSWIKNNPEYSYNFFNDKEIRQYIKNNFEKKVLTAFDMLVPGAYKADLWRYCILYKEGGVYADAKQINLVPLDKIIGSDVDFISVKDEKRNAIFNAFICTVPNHPYMKKAIDISVDNILNKKYNRSWLDITGPQTLGEAILSVLKSKKDLDIGVFTSKYGKYELLESDHDDGVIIKDGNCIIQIEHNGFIGWSNHTGIPHYGDLWVKRKVYKDTKD